MSSLSVDIPSVSHDFSDWSYNQDPYPYLEEWRRLGRVVFNERHNVYMVTSYRDCAKVIGNTKYFDSHGHIEMFKRLFGGVTMEAVDGTRHHEMRSVWSSDFERGALEDTQTALVTRVVEACVDSFVERVRSGEVVDALAGMTRRIPTLIIAEMLGIDSADHEQFGAWSDAMSEGLSGSLDPSRRGEKAVQDGVAATEALNNYMAQAIADRRRRPVDSDLVSHMVHHPVSGTMDEAEIIASNTQLVFAGNSTTARLMALTLIALAQHPDQRRALAADRSLVPRAIEEVHRWQTLIQSLPRHACADNAFIGDMHIPNGAEMRPLMGAANRDPERWGRPHEFDIFREPRAHLGFGFGIHVCLGLNLARLELRIWLNRMLDLLPDFDLADTVEYGLSSLTRAPVAVPIGLAQ